MFRTSSRVDEVQTQLSTRTYRLDLARERVLRASSLRRPQREAFDKVHDILRFLDSDLGQTPPAELARKIKELHPSWTIAADLPAFTIALATGVGKTRLMGALAAYLFLARQSSNFLFLAPRSAILTKFEDEVDPASRKYLFIDPSLIPTPRVCFRGNIETFDFAQAEVPDAPNVFLFSPQSFVGDDKRVGRVSEFTGSSVRDFLSSRSDLIAFVDEAHHLGKVAERETKAWTQAVRELKPRVQIGLTATPRDESGSNVLYKYDLPTCLREKLYTKGVRVIVRQRTKEFGDDDWDHHTLDFALDRLARKESAIQEYSGGAPFPHVRPVLLVCAENTSHADRVAAWLLANRNLDRSEILVTHSEKTKTEEDVGRLLAIESPDSRVRVIVNVYELTEGWDVTNVYVIAPLRRMGTFQGAIQTMGRGLRLPAGRRVDDVELDSLDILCFGKESLNEVLSTALRDFGDDDEAETGVAVKEAGDVELQRPLATETVDVDVSSRFEILLPTARRLPIEPELDFDPGVLRGIAHIPAAEFELTEGAVVGSAEGLKYPRTTFARFVVGRVLTRLRYLSEPLHWHSLEVLVEKFLDKRGIAPDGVVELDWMKVAEFIAEQIDRPYRKKSATFEVLSQPVPIAFESYRWNVAPEEKVALPNGPKAKWGPTMFRRLIGGWRRCSHKAAAFDSGGEFEIAKLLDRSASVVWWSRNDPPRLRIPTPIGFYEPDFVMEVKRPSPGYLLLECKRADFWKPPESDARVKAAAADAWAKAVGQAGLKWEHWLVLDADVPHCSVLEDLNRVRANTD